jgi:hypothetical protein
MIFPMVHQSIADRRPSAGPVTGTVTLIQDTGYQQVARKGNRPSLP